MEACSSYRPWHDKATGKTYLKPDSSKCMTYYFCLMDKRLGLCYLRVPTWCPFRLQVYFNGHNWLANQLKERGIAYEMLDNAFVHIADYALANQLANAFRYAPQLVSRKASAPKVSPMSAGKNASTGSAQ